MKVNSLRFCYELRPECSIGSCQLRGVIKRCIQVCSGRLHPRTGSRRKGLAARQGRHREIGRDGASDAKAEGAAQGKAKQLAYISAFLSTFTWYLMEPIFNKTTVAIIFKNY